jgi:hypothetical protein
MNRIKFALLTAAAAIPLAGVMLASAAGPNLVKNGDFTNGVTGWDNFGTAPVAFNNAMQVTNAYAGTGNSYYGAEQCITGIQAGQDYVATAEVFVGDNQPEGGMAGVYFHFRNDPNCNGNNLGGGHMANGYAPENRGKWVTLTHNVTAPAGSKSLLIVASAVKEPVQYADSVPGSMVALFDNITLKKADVIIVKPTATPTQKPDPSPTAQPTAQPTANPTQAPQDTGDVVSNPQPTSTPQAPNTGDSGPAGQDTPADDSGSTGSVDVIPSGGPNIDTTSQDDPTDAANQDVVSPAVNHEGGSAGLGLGLVFIGAGVAFAAVGLGVSAVAGWRREED